MIADSKGRGLLIVDNSVSGWTGLRYLEEWSGIDLTGPFCTRWKGSDTHT